MRTKPRQEFFVPTTKLSTVLLYVNGVLCCAVGLGRARWELR